MGRVDPVATESGNIIFGGYDISPAKRSYQTKFAEFTFKVDARVLDCAAPGRGGNRPVVKLCSPYPRLFFFGITDMIGVDSCVFLIFTTRVGLKTG